jgi:hypothetical protein
MNWRSVATKYNGFFVTNLSHQALDTNIMMFAAAAMSLLLTLGLTSFGLMGATTQKKTPNLRQPRRNPLKERISPRFGSPRKI